MTTLPPNYLRLSSKWLETNPLPEDGLLLEADDTWKPSSQRGRITATPGFDYATARTDLPKEAYAETEPDPDLTQPGLPKAGLTQPEAASERAEDHCGVSSVEFPAKVLHTEKVRMKIGPEGVESVETDSERTIATLRAQLDAKEGECQRLAQKLVDENSRFAVAESAAYDRGRQHELTEGDWIEVEKERDKLRAEVEHRAKQRDEFQNLFIEASDGFNQRGEQLARLTAELDAVRKERDALQRFKDWVHTYLDEHGVPHHPPGTHGAEGCRIGDRMDWLMAKRDAAQARCGELERKIDIIETEWERQKNLFPVLSKDGWMDSVIMDAKLLTPSQQPDNFDSSGVECQAVDRQTCRESAGAENTQEANTQPPYSQRGNESVRIRPAVTPSRSEPVKAGEWHKPNVDDAIGGEMLGYHPEWVHEEFCPDGIRSCIHDGEMWHSSTWRDDDSNILRHSYSLAPLLVRPLPAPPTAPEGKATEVEG